MKNNNFCEQGWTFPCFICTFILCVAAIYQVLCVFEIGFLVISVDIYCIVRPGCKVRKEGEIVRSIRQSKSVWITAFPWHILLNNQRQEIWAKYLVLMDLTNITLPGNLDGQGQEEGFYKEQIVANDSLEHHDPAPTCKHCWHQNLQVLQVTPWHSPDFLKLYKRIIIDRIREGKKKVNSTIHQPFNC